MLHSTCCNQENSVLLRVIARQAVIFRKQGVPGGALCFGGRGSDLGRERRGENKHARSIHEVKSVHSARRKKLRLLEKKGPSLGFIFSFESSCRGGSGSGVLLHARRCATRGICEGARAVYLAASSSVSTWMRGNMTFSWRR